MYKKGQSHSQNKKNRISRLYDYQKLAGTGHDPLDKAESMIFPSKDLLILSPIIQKIETGITSKQSSSKIYDL